MEALDEAALWQRICIADDMRLFALAEGIRRGFDIEEINRRTLVDPFFLRKIANIVSVEERLAALKPATDACMPNDALLSEAVLTGFTDTGIGRLTGMPAEQIRTPRKAIGLGVN